MPVHHCPSVIGCVHPGIVVRIVTTTCSNTEIVCALGCADWLVGVDEHSDFPEDVVGRLPRVGPDLGIDPKKVAALHPDLVIASLTVPGHEKVVQDLRDEGLNVVAPQPLSLQDVWRDIRDIAQLLGFPERGERLAQRLSDAIPIPPTDPTGPRILVEWWPKPVIVPGKKSWVTDLIHAAGGVSVLGHEDVESRPLHPGEGAVLAPDAVVIAWCGVPFEKYRIDVVTRRPDWQQVPALQHNRVIPISEAWLGRPGPRLLEGFHALKAVVDSCKTSGPCQDTPD
ncbi:MAG: iron complex transport system substrate-binding protein [Myxococcota bacterium]|jgi:iron complex transport system substrate-binding protein